jgi:hypothetical protein
MGHHLADREGEGAEKIELGDDASILPSSTTGKALKSCFSNNASRSRMVCRRVTVITARVMN